MIKAIIFDMDGVIIDTMKIHKETDKQALETFGLHLSDKEFTEFSGLQFKEIAKRMGEKHNKEIDIEKVYNIKYSILDNLIPKVQLYPGVLNLIKNLDKRMILSVSTSSPQIFAHKVLNYLDILQIFEFILTADEITKSKPDKMAYDMAIKKLKLKPSECVVIEDAQNGVISAKSAGTYCIGITNNETRDSLAQADLIIDNLDEINYEKIQNIAR